MRIRVASIEVALAALLAAGAVALWYWRIIASAVEPYQGGIPAADFYLQIYPMAERAAEWIREGRLPLWNPYQFGGHPFLATGIYGILYPLNFPYLLLPAEIAMEATMVMHLAASGVLMYAFARVLLLSRVGAVTAGITFMWSGFVVGELFWFPPAVCASPWLALGLLAVERLRRDPRPLWSAVLAIAVALSFLAGWPQTWMYTMYVIALFGSVRLLDLLRRDRRRALRVAVLMTAGVVLGMALAGAQLLPGLELQSHGPRRAGGLSLEQARAMAPPAPSWFLDQARNSHPAGRHLSYMGIATMFPVLLSLFRVGSRAPVVVFWLLGLASAGVALGPNAPFFDYYRMLPGMAWFRAPQRILYVYAFAVAILSGIGMDALAAAREGASSRRRTLMVAVVAGAALALLLGVSLPRLSRAYLAAGLILTAVAIVIAPLRRAAVVALVAIVAFDLFYAEKNRIQHPYHDPSVFTREKAIFDYIKANQKFDRTFINTAFDFPAMMSKHGTLAGVYSITDYEPLSLWRYQRFYELLEAPSDHHPSYVTFTGKVNAKPTTAEFSRIDLLSVRYLITSRLEMRFGAGWLTTGKWRALPRIGRRSRHVIVENARVLPRTYVAHVATHVVGEPEALAAVGARGFDPWESVVLEGYAPSLVGDTQAPQPITPARIVHYDPTEVIIEADAERPGYLVLTDTFYPGWYATVDGEPATIYQANYLFRAVPIDPGHHRVVFRYTPTSFRLGAAISLLALVGIVAILGYEVVSARRSRASPSEVF